MMSEASASRPVTLSVIVVAIYEHSHLLRCLESFENQIDRPPMEILVVRPAGEDVSWIEQRFDGVRALSAKSASTQADMLALALSRASGDVIALTVDHCTVEERWCARCVAAHQSPHAAVGGPLEKGSQADTAVNWAVHFYDYCSYGYYQYPGRRGPARELSDCNVSYKKRALDRIARDWPGGFHVPLVNRALVAAGETLWFSPDLLVYQHRSIDCSRAARVAYRRGRAFASVRLTTFGFIQRCVRTALSPLLPLGLTAKLVLNMARRHAHLGAFVRAFPFVLLFSASWACGEFLGLLLGRPDYRVSVADE